MRTRAALTIAASVATASIAASVLAAPDVLVTVAPPPDAAPVPDAPADAEDAGDAGGADVGASDAADAADAQAGSEAPDAAPSEGAANASAPDAGKGHYEPSDVGFTFGLRAGFAVPFGLAHSGASHFLLSDVIAHAIPVGGEVGYFFTRNFFVGGYFLYGFASNAGGASSNELCNDPSYTCSAEMFRFGATARWHFTPERGLDPWAGLALGYNVLNVTATDDTTGDQAASSLHGFEASAIGGLDIKPKTFFGLGPYVELSLGHYANDESATALYGYFGFGLRLRTGL